MFKKYYRKPTQVLFFDRDKIDKVNYKIEYKRGIAYQDEIICGCCGYIFSIEDILEEFNDYKEEFQWLDSYEPICNLKWADITKTINGELA